MCIKDDVGDAKVVQLSNLCIAVVKTIRCLCRNFVAESFAYTSNNHSKSLTAS